MFPSLKLMVRPPPPPIFPLPNPLFFPSFYPFSLLFFTTSFLPSIPFTLSLYIFSSYPIFPPSFYLFSPSTYFSSIFPPPPPLSLFRLSFSAAIFFPLPSIFSSSILPPHTFTFPLYFPLPFFLNPFFPSLSLF